MPVKVTVRGAAPYEDNPRRWFSCISDDDLGKALFHATSRIHNFIKNEQRAGFVAEHTDFIFRMEVEL